jgi:ribosomal protein L31
MKFLGIICLLAILAPAASANAEYYRYSDPHGNVIYTDDINNVPDAQRANARVSDVENLTPPGTGASAVPPDTGSPSKAVSDDLKMEQEELAALKSKLEQEYKALADENARLRVAQKSAITPAQRKAFNIEVVSFNTRFQAYKEKEAAYQSRLEKFDKRYGAAMSKADKQ